MSDSGGSDHQSLESDSEPFASLILYEFKKKKNKQTSEEEEEYGETNRGKRKRANRSTVEAKKKAKMDDRNLNSSSFRHQHMQLRLRIPISVLSTLSNNPLAWMTYVGGAILGVEGNVPDAYPDKDEIENGDVFHFVADDALAEDYTRLTKAVDIGTILRRTPSMTATSLHLDFYESLLPRDGGCVFTGDEGSLFTHGAHLIPFARQNTWLQLLDNQRNTNVRDINDIRNGVIVGLAIHASLDARVVAILPTPNIALDVNDIPRNEEGRELGSKQKFPKKRRYTLQWLTTPMARSTLVPPNRDAAFVDTSPKTLPSTELLDYIYGASVLQQMGEETDGFDLYKDVQEHRRPPAPTRSKYKARTEADRQDLAEKRGRGDDDDDGDEGAADGSRGGSGEASGSGAEPGQAGRRRSGRLEARGRGGGGGSGEQSSRTAARRSGSGVWKKLTAESAEAWMLFFHMNTGQASELLEEYEHTQPESILQWSTNVTSGVSV